MINAEQRKNQNDITHSSPQEARHKVWTEFQQILNILGNNSKHSSFRTPKDEDFQSSGLNPTKVLSFPHG